MNKKSNTLHKIKLLRNVSAKHRKFDKIRTTTGTAAFIYADIIGFERVYLSYLFVSKAKGNKKNGSRHVTSLTLPPDWNGC